MKNIKRTLLIGLTVGIIFFGWILYEFYSQNWNFNLFSLKDWDYVWNEFVSGWIISATSDWIFIISIVCAIPVFIFLWRLFCHIPWGRLFLAAYHQIKRLIMIRNPKQVIQKKIKVKARQSHKKVRPRPMNTTGRPLPKMAGKTMDADTDAALTSTTPESEAGLAKTLNTSTEPHPAFLDEDINNIPLEDIKMPERVRLEEDLVTILSESNYQVVKDITLDKIRLAYVGISADQVVLCMEDTEKGDWLADEEFFNDEEPLWFSETSHRISPVYQLLTTAKAFDAKVKNRGFAQTVTPILIEKEGTIINAEDMTETWQKLGVVVCRTDLGGPDELPGFEAALPKAADRGTARDLESIRGLF